MGDSETLVAETSAVMSYTSTGYTNTTGYADANTNAVPDASAFAPGTAGDYVTSSGPMDAAYSVPGVGDGNAYSMDPNAIMQQASAAGASGSGDNVAGSENAAGGLSHAPGYSTINGSVGSEAGNVTSIENGSSSGVASGAAAGQEHLDSSGMFPLTCCFCHVVFVISCIALCR